MQSSTPDSCVYLENPVTGKFCRIIAMAHRVETHSGKIGTAGTRTIKEHIHSTKAFTVSCQKRIDKAKQGYRKVADPDPNFGPGLIEIAEQERAERFAQRPQRPVAQSHFNFTAGVTE